MPADTGTPWFIPYPLPADIPDDPTQSRERAEQIHECLDLLNLRPVLRCRKTAAQNIPSTGTPATITFPLKDEDPDAMADATGATFTVKKAGIWTVSACLAWGPSTAGPRWLSIHVGGVYQAGVASMAITTAGWNIPLSVTVNLRLAVGNVVTVGGAQASGAALDTSTAYPGTLSMLWQRP
jgi:hypothetical protein